MTWIRCLIHRSGIYQRLILRTLVRVNVSQQEREVSQGKALLMLIRLENVAKRLTYEFGLHSQMDDAYLLPIWRPTKMTPRARCAIVHEVSEESRVRSKLLKTCFILANDNVHESITRRTLKNIGVHGESPRKK